MKQDLDTANNGPHGTNAIAPVRPRARNPHVGIVGAGVAGLRCAEYLLNHGLRVSLIEARGRVGGRICQSEESVLGYKADLGPNWIHTSGDNPILKLALETQTPLHVWNEGVRLWDKGGMSVPEEKANQLSDLRWRIIDEAFKYSSQHGDEIDPKASLYDFFVERVAKIDAETLVGSSGERFGEFGEREREMLLGMCQMWGDYTGDPIQRQSLKYVWLEEVCGGEECIVTSSFEAILAKVAEVPLKRAAIQYNTRATGFRTFQDADGYTKVEVEILDGDVQVFDEVVVTTPLGWLKANKNSFSPPLPSDIIQSIDTISIGHLEKMYITFPTAFWRPKTTTGELDRSIPEYTNWLSPTYAPSTNPQSWPQEAYDLSAFAAPYARPTLLMYLYGPLSKHIATIIHTNPDPITRHALLSAFFMPYISLLPYYDPSSPFCTPSAFLGTAWQFDELAGNGSYCNLQVGIDSADERIRVLQRGMPERAVWFAGEHASPFEELGTAAGAWISGERVGEWIVERYGGAGGGGGGGSGSGEGRKKEGER